MNKKFASMVSSNVSHNDLNSVGVIDKNIIKLLKWCIFPERSGHKNNTVVVLFGDHGCRVGKFRSTIQGKLEERLPFMSITLPSHFNSQQTHKELTLEIIPI